MFLCLCWYLRDIDIMILVIYLIFIATQPNDTMLLVWKVYMFYPFKSCTIILQFNHDPISILFKQVYILNTFTYLSHSDVFKTALHIFLGNSHSCFPTFLFYYRFTKKLSKRVYVNLRYMTFSGTWHTFSGF